MADSGNWYGNAFQSLLENINRHQKMLDAFQGRGFQPFIDSIKQQERMLESVSSFAKQQQAMMKTACLIPESLAVWNQLWHSTAATIARANLVVGDVLASRLLEPERVYADFSAKTRGLIKCTSDNRTKSALQKSVELSEIQLLKSRSVVRDLLVSSGLSEDNSPILPVFPLKLVVIQGAELRACNQDLTGASYADILQCSSASRAADDTHSLLNNVVYCNEFAETDGKPGIFKLTTNVLASFNDLHHITPENKNDFTNFVNCLYWIFYEGAGGKKLRFLRANGGVLNDSDCNFIWTFKHLRNKWLIHDVEHGSPAEIRESRALLRKALERLGLCRMPISEDDYRLLHRNLLASGIAFINNLINELHKTATDISYGET